MRRFIHQTIVVLTLAILPSTVLAQPAKKKPIEITPTKLDQERVEKPLSGKIRDVCVGGGGRFLICHLPDDRKIVVFDVCKAEIVHTVPANDDQVQFTAGMDKLFVYLGNSSIITRHSLETFKSELSYRLPPRSLVEGLHMGSASYGPVMVNAQTVEKKPITFFVDAATMKVANYINGDPKQKNQQWGSEGEFIRVSANGKVFACWRPTSSPQGFHTLTLVGSAFRTVYEHVTYGHLNPSADGKTIYTAKGLYTVEGRPLSEQSIDKSTRYQLDYTIPAAEGNLYYLSVGITPRRTAESLNIHLVGDKRPIAVLTDIDLPADRGLTFDRKAMGLEKRFYLIPSADLIVSIPQTDDRLVLHRFSLEKYLNDSPFDYLLVLSRPPQTARRDGSYSYALKVMSKVGGLKYRLETAPMGMTISDEGKISWNVPFLFRPNVQHVVVSITDKGGTQTTHTFDIAILDRTP